MAIQDFANDLQENVALKRKEYDSPDLAFTAHIVEQIATQTNVNEFKIEHHLKKGANDAVQGEIYGYGISENNEVLTLYYTIYDANTENGLTKINRVEFDKAVNRMQGFYEVCRRAWCQDLADEDPNNPALETATFIYKNNQDFARVNLCILTNHIMEDGYEIRRIRLGQIPVESSVWDIRKIYGNLKKTSDHIEINLDFESELRGYKLPCIEMQSEKYRCVSTLFPAKLLYRLYEQYNTDLLMNNVRLFLQFKGGSKKPNPSMRETLTNDPQMFLAFNNGITAIAKDIVIDKSNTKLSLSADDPFAAKGDNALKSNNDFVSTGMIKSISDFQIVNGGQTTAVIFKSKKMNPNVNLLGVFVSVKLIIMNEDLQDLTQRICYSSNNNNTVKPTDYSSTNTFNLRLQEMSRNIVAPNAQHRIIHWYYERVRGQYAAELDNLTKKQDQATFKNTYPLEKRFDKELLAKVFVAWSENPEEAVKGASTTYTYFMKRMTTEGVLPDDIFFKKIVALLIMHNYLMKRPDAKALGNAKAPVAAYTMAYLKWFTQGRIDLIKIWDNQALSESLIDFLDKLSKIVYDEFLSCINDKGVTSILSWSKNKKAFEELKHIKTGLSYFSIEKDIIGEKF